MKNYITILFAVTMTAMLTLAENAMAQAKTQAELKEYAASLFSTVSLDPNDIVILSNSLKKRNLTLEIRGKNYAELAKAHKSKDWLKMISLLDIKGQQYTEYPAVNIIHWTFENLLKNELKWNLLIKGNMTGLDVTAGFRGNRENPEVKADTLGLVSIVDFEPYCETIRKYGYEYNGFAFPTVRPYGNSRYGKWELHPDGIGCYAEWSPVQGKDYLVLLIRNQKSNAVDYYGHFEAKWKTIQEAYSSKKKKIILDELSTEQADKEMRQLLEPFYKSVVAEVMKRFQNQ